MSENKNTCEVWENSNCVKCEKLPYVIIIVLLIIISVLAFFVGKNYDVIFNWWSKNSNITTGSWNVVANDIVVKIVWDKRCNECQTDTITASLKQVPFLAWSKFEEMDFSDKGAKEFIKANWITALPAFLLNTNNVPDAQFAQYLTETPAGLFSLNVWSEFDPFWEVCWNTIDDNEDWLIDCADPKCSKDLTCAPKVERPVADLYIMSYCPYGLQAQKWYLEVISKLSKVADINVKWVPYIMHGQKETDENTAQYCIQKNEKEKYAKYLNCFLAAEGKEVECRKEAGINETLLSSCIEEADKTFNISEKMKDTSKQFPDYDIDREQALAAWVQWSPTFVLNGIKIDKIGRNAKAYADAICSTFENKPAECDQDFQSVNFDPMFGFTSNGANADSGCAQ